MAVPKDFRERGPIRYESNTEVALVSMPFGSALQPSIGLGLLKAVLTNSNVKTRVFYFTLRFAELVGSSFYRRIASGDHDVTDLVGEWIFAEALFDHVDTQGYIANVLRRPSPSRYDNAPLSEIAIDEILAARSHVDAFLHGCCETILATTPAIVGFTSLFQQQVASLALARRIKQRAPGTYIVFGGPNCEGIMGAELVQQFNFVDAVVSGEGESVLPDLVDHVLHQKAESPLQGVLYQTQRRRDTDGPSPLASAPAVRQLDCLPYPDYSDFFEQFALTSLATEEQPWLLFETSRGCWWAERMICTFCGLNGDNIAYRSKSAARALEELRFLLSTYPGCPVAVVDNIMDVKYYRDFLPALASSDLDAELFYDIKANVKKNHVKLLSEAGVRWIQPGIESLSDQVLRIMRKGVRAVQNIQLLKWCAEFGVRPHWNLIWGFPGEDPREYQKMAALVPLISHLTPPDAAGTMRLDRFSPNFEKARDFGLIDIAPYPAYAYTYPLSPDAVARLAYYFTFSYAHPQDVDDYTRPLAAAVAAWKESHERSHLVMIETGPNVILCDSRPVAKEDVIVLDDRQSAIYMACDQARSASDLLLALSEHLGKDVSPRDVETLLQPLIDAGVMLQDGPYYLSLAVRPQECELSSELAAATSPILDATCSQRSV